MSELSFADHLALWVGAALTFMIFSFLYKDNPFYKFAEHLFVGVSAAYWMVVGFWTTLIPNGIGKVFPEMVSIFLPNLSDTTPNYYFLIPIILGIMMLTRLFGSIGWISRWPMAIIIGFSAGTNLTRYLQSDFIHQVHSSSVPLVVLENGSFAWMATFSNVVLVFGVIAALLYFFFSLEHKGIIGGASKFGIWILMITFGAAFGYTVMARISLLLGRFEFLQKWLQSFLV
ncbi:MAG: hypothetical protein N2450_05600 [bacterium]|nr:hypothetical protein [bacterium]